LVLLKRLKIYSFKFISVNFEIPEVNKAQVSLWQFRLLQL